MTQEELLTNLTPHVEAMAAQYNVTPSEYRNALYAAIYDYVRS